MVARGNTPPTTDSELVGGLTRKFEQELSQMVGEIGAEEFRPARFRRLLGDMGSLLAGIGREAITQIVEDRDAAHATLEVGGHRLRYRGRLLDTFGGAAHSLLALARPLLRSARCRNPRAAHPQGPDRRTAGRASFAPNSLESARPFGVSLMSLAVTLRASRCQLPSPATRAAGRKNRDVRCASVPSLARSRFCPLRWPLPREQWEPDSSANQSTMLVSALSAAGQALSNPRRRGRSTTTAEHVATSSY